MYMSGLFNNSRAAIVGMLSHFRSFALLFMDFKARSCLIENLFSATSTTHLRLMAILIRRTQFALYCLSDSSSYLLRVFHSTNFRQLTLWSKVSPEKKSPLEADLFLVEGKSTKRKAWENSHFSPSNPRSQLLASPDRRSTVSSWSGNSILRFSPT